MPTARLPVVLASASPARRALLKSAGLDPIVHVSGVDEAAVSAPTTAGLVCALARLKGDSVAAEIGTARDCLLIAADSLLDVDGRPLGKPASDSAVRASWARIRGRSADLVTGHHVVLIQAGQATSLTQAVTTTVTFANVTDAEVDSYIATGEPHHVAGAFTIDGYGAAFIEGVSGDPHNVVGLSIPALRTMTAGLGVDWTDLWVRTTDR